MTPAYRYRAELVRVIDGDTIEVDLDLGLYTWVRRQSLRLRDVDAPELDTPEGCAVKAAVEALFADRRLVVETLKNRRLDDARSFTRWIADVWDAKTGLHLNQAIRELLAGRGSEPLRGIRTG